jgi:hypothetical protein
MTKEFNICVIQPVGYVHSAAFSEIADLLLYSIRDIGYQAVKSSSIDHSKINIIIGIHLLDSKFAKDLPSTSIIINTEQLGGVIEGWNQNIVRWFESGLELWDYSEVNINYLKQFGIKNVKRLRFGYQPELRTITANNERDIDVLFYGSIHDRRKFILQELHQKGLKVKLLFGVYGQERDHWISRSKVVLNIHLYESQIFEIVRVFYLLTNSVAVVGEVNKATSIEPRFKDGILASPYDKLVDSTIEIVGNDGKLKEQREKAYATISQYPQAIFTRALIN